jgi:hypothetical protein
VELLPALEHEKLRFTGLDENGLAPVRQLR